MRRIYIYIIPVLFAVLLLAGCAGGPRPVAKAERIYRQAYNAMITERWNAAAAKYRQLLATYPFGKYATQARLNLIYTYFRAGMPEEAGRQADSFARENQASPYVPYALYIKGVAYAMAMQPGLLDKAFIVNMSRRDPHDQQRAFAAFKQLATRYPANPYAQQAKRWMVYVRNRLARFNLGVARFYFRRKEWVAAVNRAAIIVTRFPRTPAAKPALKILAQSYRALGEKQLATAAADYYRYNFKSKAAAD